MGPHAENELQQIDPGETGMFWSLMMMCDRHVLKLHASPPFSAAGRK